MVNIGNLLLLIITQMMKYAIMHLCLSLLQLRQAEADFIQRIFPGSYFTSTGADEGALSRA
jgi:hypothetical protein